MALQSGAEERPWDLLSGGGLHSGIGHPVLSALHDYRIRDRARALGVVVAAGHIRSVALLTALGLSATLGAGLNRLTLDEMRRLNDEYGEGLPHFEFEPDAEPDGVSAEVTASPAEEIGVERGSAANNHEQDVTHDVEIDVPPSPPALLLMDWDPFEICSAPQSWIRHAAMRLAEVRRNAGLPLGGICVWRPHEDTLDQLRFAVNARDSELARAALVDSLDAAADFEEVLADPRVGSHGPNDVHRSAAARLGVRRRDQLDELDPEGNAPERAAAIEQELLSPLREFALTRSNPVVRNTVVLLADVAQLLYLLGPQVQDALGRSLTSAVPSDTTHGTLNQYLSLVDRYGRLCGALRSWSR